MNATSRTKMVQRGERAARYLERVTPDRPFVLEAGCTPRQQEGSARVIGARCGPTGKRRAYDENKRSRDFARTYLTPAAFAPRFEIERYLEGLRDVEEVVILVPTPDELQSDRQAGSGDPAGQ